MAYYIEYRGTFGGHIKREFEHYQRAQQWLRQIGRKDLIKEIRHSNSGRRVSLFTDE